MVSLLMPTSAAPPNGPPFTGQIYYNTIKSCSYLYDGYNWIHLPLPGSAPYVQSPEDLCALYPGLAQLKQELDTAQEKFDAYLTLVKNNG